MLKTIGVEVAFGNGDGVIGVAVLVAVDGIIVDVASAAGVGTGEQAKSAPKQNKAHNIPRGLLLLCDIAILLIVRQQFVFNLLCAKSFNADNFVAFVFAKENFNF